MAVALSVPTDRRLDADGLEALVRAIAAASADEPETDSLEWKGALELSGRKARFQLARTLLGFGNRSVHQAQRAFEGYAYLVAGVGPGNLCGVALPDPAEIENALDGFISHGHPNWRLHQATVDGITAAVIEVAPPQDGDRICCLHSTYESTPAGRIFVRRQGQTREATPDAIRALEERYAAKAIALQQETHAWTSQHLTLEQERDAREQTDRAERNAPRFAAGRIGDGFVHAAPEEVRGIVRNVGGATGTITETRLLLDPRGAYPGAGVPVYGQGPTGDFGMPVRIEQGVHVLLRYVHPNLQYLSQDNHVLTVELRIEDDAGFQWRQLLVSRRDGADRQGHHRWTVRQGESEWERVAQP
jgi:hypothetical protein